MFKVTLKEEYDNNRYIRARGHERYFARKFYTTKHVNMVRRYHSLLRTNMTCHRKSTAHMGTQTVIRVYPHILDPQQNARTASDKKMQTEVSIKPDDKNEMFYSMLKYTPYQDIQEDCIRIIDLPRKVHLQFTAGVEFDKMAQAARQFSLVDDDGVGYICCELIHRFEKRNKQPAYVEIGVQTELVVFPHLLKEENVAMVMNEIGSQTELNGVQSDGVGKAEDMVVTSSTVTD